MILITEQKIHCLPYIGADHLEKILDSEVEYTPNILLIDVRTPAEYDAGLIAGPTINIPYTQIDAALALSPAEFMHEYAYNHYDFKSSLQADGTFDADLESHAPHNTIIFYCRTNRRSRFATGRAWMNGFRAAYLKDGIVGWAGFDPADPDD